MKHAKIENSLGCHESAVTTKFYPEPLGYFDTPFSAISSVPNLLALRGGCIAPQSGRGPGPARMSGVQPLHEPLCGASGICCAPNSSSISHMSPEKLPLVQPCLCSGSSNPVFLCVSRSCP